MSADEERAAIDARVKEVLASAPPLSPTKAAEIRRIFQGAGK